MAAASSPDIATPRPPSHPPPPLPSGWQLINEEGQRPYFWNEETGESTWVRPVEEGKEGGGHTMEEDKHLTTEPPVMLTLLNTKLPVGFEDTALVKPLMDI
ncbi:hypothetical protein EMCRGX_G026801 [Ephydatia muelleri]